MADFSKAGESNDKPGGLVFNWLHDGPAPRDAGAGVSIRGTLTLTATELFSFCLSQERMDALTALLEERLGSLVRFKISRRTPLKAPAAKPSRKCPSRNTSRTCGSRGTLRRGFEKNGLSNLVLK